MKLLLVAATETEIGPFLASGAAQAAGMDVLITGVGMVATTFALTRKLATQHYDFAIQAGVAGSYDGSMALGSLALVSSEQFGDLGAEDHDKYIDLFELGLLAPGTFPYHAGKLVTPSHILTRQIDLPQVSGLTVNTVAGSERSIVLRKNKFGCQVESMEGAAFHYVCLQENIPFAQVRAISNYVAPRDKGSWKMKEAVVALNKWLVDFTARLQ